MREKEEPSTAEEADAEAQATANADTKGGTHLPELRGFDNWKLPQQTLALLLIPFLSISASPAHHHLLLCLSPLTHTISSPC